MLQMMPHFVKPLQKITSGQNWFTGYNVQVDKAKIHAREPGKIWAQFF